MKVLLYIILHERYSNLSVDIFKQWVYNLEDVIANEIHHYFIPSY